MQLALFLGYLSLLFTVSVTATPVSTNAVGRSDLAVGMVYPATVELYGHNRRIGETNGERMRRGLNPLPPRISREKDALLLKRVTNPPAQAVNAPLPSRARGRRYDLAGDPDAATTTRCFADLDPKRDPLPLTLDYTSITDLADKCAYATEYKIAQAGGAYENRVFAITTDTARTPYNCFASYYARGDNGPCASPQEDSQFDFAVYYSL